MYFEKLCEGFKALESVEALVLGGSRASGKYDEKSDYDLYIYCYEVPKIEERGKIIDEVASYSELNNTFWEREDDITLLDGVDVDIIYRSLDSLSNDIKDVVENYNARCGYTTCFYHNLLYSTIIFDRNGRYEELKRRYSIAYPKELKKNIIEKNMKLLRGYLPSYDKQILKASRRKDIVSINHRIAAFLESYFDIIFALNEMTHPGEKRMLEIATKEAKILPRDFEKNVEELLFSMFSSTDELKERLERIIAELEGTISLCLI